MDIVNDDGGLGVIVEEEEEVVDGIGIGDSVRFEAVTEVLRCFNRRVVVVDEEEGGISVVVNDELWSVLVDFKANVSLANALRRPTNKNEKNQYVRNIISLNTDNVNNIQKEPKQENTINNKVYGSEVGGNAVATPRPIG